MPGAQPVLRAGAGAVRGRRLRLRQRGGGRGRPAGTGGQGQAGGGQLPGGRRDHRGRGLGPMATAEDRPPVEDWATDYDIFEPQYFTDPGPIWADLRQRCPVAHTDRWGGSWIATRYDDVAEMARMVPALSSQEFTVV